MNSKLLLIPALVIALSSCSWHRHGHHPGPPPHSNYRSYDSYKNEVKARKKYEKDKWKARKQYEKDMRDARRDYYRHH
ncbi:MAG TPA: hypothetical protein H9862_03980 [Candidatus Akkermansia intestinigallinarum]|uniref:Lipoprotein n=1 Tax=Candidatus Akkermansia intestinigallinarum TaxID=2838431 RepID=A0A9D2AGV5_9BACT|nr:hypothetical protein [Candidatus Akkermansia intestinigallinarum]